METSFPTLSTPGPNGPNVQLWRRLQTREAVRLAGPWQQWEPCQTESVSSPGAKFIIVSPHRISWPVVTRDQRTVELVAHKVAHFFNVLRFNSGVWETAKKQCGGYAWYVVFSETLRLLERVGCWAGSELLTSLSINVSFLIVVTIARQVFHRLPGNTGLRKAWWVAVTTTVGRAVSPTPSRHARKPMGQEGQSARRSILPLQNVNTSATIRAGASLTRW